MEAGRRKLSVTKMLVLILAVATIGITMVTNQASSAASMPLQNPDDVRVTKGLAISPVPLNLQGRNRAMVGLGSYIVNAQGGCNDCHTKPAYLMGGDPYAGDAVEKVNAANYLAGGEEFGPFKSRNITPDKVTGLPANLTFEVFLSTIRTGVDPDKLHPMMGPLLQVMPWAVYRSMSDSDLRAVYEFLSAIPHAEPRP